MSKVEYGAKDAQPIILYAKLAESDSIAYPVIIGADGRLLVDIDMASEDIATETTLNKLVGFAADDNLTITKTVVGVVKTFVFTNGVKTKTVVINPTTGVYTTTWS